MKIWNKNTMCPEDDRNWDVLIFPPNEWAFFKFYLFILRARETEAGGGRDGERERERERERESQEGSSLPTWSLTWGSNPQTMKS